MVARGLAQQRARLDLCKVYTAGQFLEEPRVVGCIDRAATVAVKVRVVEDRGRRAYGRRRVASRALRRHVVQDVLQHILDARKAQVRRVYEIVVYCDHHVLRIRVRATANRELDSVGTRGRSEEDRHLRGGVGNQWVGWTG